MDTKTKINKLELEFISSLAQVDAADWNRLASDGYPFMRYEFLAALENSGSVSEQSGWQPHHLVGYRDGRPVAIMPLYIKTHSYGEYVFDWAWANAYHRNGFQYYPKLLTAIPFTPASGSRLCLDISLNRQSVTHQVVQQIKHLAEVKGYSSWHVLFPQQVEFQAFADSQLSQRTGCQYHWFNRDYADFDDFLAQLSSRKRKNIKRERRRVREQGISLKTFTGKEIDKHHIRTFYQFYQATYYKRAQKGYLTLDFFNKLLEGMAEQLVLVLAFREDHPIAGALSICGNDTLYGRYWGCLEEYECLHFEACYYQGIEFCIAQGLNKFDPGAQGEHKIARGFEPTPTYSVHWLVHPAFRQAINKYLEDEAVGIDQYMHEAAKFLPFKKT